MSVALIHHRIAAAQNRAGSMSSVRPWAMAGVDTDDKSDEEEPSGGALGPEYTRSEMDVARRGFPRSSA